MLKMSIESLISKANLTASSSLNGLFWPSCFFTLDRSVADKWCVFVYPIDMFFVYNLSPSVSNMSAEKKRERITIRITKRYAQLLERLVDEGIYNSRNEAIRDALRLLFEHHGFKLLQQD